MLTLRHLVLEVDGSYRANPKELILLKILCERDRAFVRACGEGGAVIPLVCTSPTEALAYQNHPIALSIRRITLKPPVVKGPPMKAGGGLDMRR